MIVADRIRFATERETQFIDITQRLQSAVDAAGLRQGRIHVQSMHTTLGLTVNENEPLLLTDFEALLDRLAPAGAVYLHDDFPSRTWIADDEPVNGHAHCRQILLHPSHTALIEDGQLLLGRWQSIFAVELDGPRQREIAIQLEGDFVRETDGERHLVELELARQLAVDPPAVERPMRRLIEAGGKRLRPLMVMMAGHLGPAYHPLRSAVLAAAIELIHSATLVHDDYVDRSSVRRGRPTVAAAEGPPVATAAGDYYFAKATRMIAELGNRDVTRTVASALDAICISQLDDLGLRGRYPGDRAAYLQVVRGKTAALISAACVAGAQLAGADPAVVDRLRRYGELTGIAFQMTDDTVDFSPKSGKPLGQDIRERVLSLPLIYAAEDKRVGREVQELLTGSLGESDVVRIVALVGASGALQRVAGEARELAEAAVGELTFESPGIDGAPRRLAELALAAVGRES